MTSIDGYSALRTAGGAVRRTDRGVLAVSGSDRATWLQGLVTNDVVALADGGQKIVGFQYRLRLVLQSQPLQARQRQQCGIGLAFRNLAQACVDIASDQHYFHVWPQPLDLRAAS